MTAATAPSVRVVVQGVAGPSLAAARRFELIRALLDKGYAVSCTHAEPSAGTPADHASVVFGDVGGRTAAPADSADRVLDIDGRDTLELVASADKAREAAGVPQPGGWKPWFPVIDYQRCTNCMQCLSFCLFDVYGASAEGKIQVRNQENCKTDCPACSRVCPEVAIMFPKYRHGPINGEIVSADDLRREAMKVDISTLLGGDIYAALRDRSAKAKSRFSKERDDQRALKERQNCLVKLRQALDVPAELLAALPSQDEIRTKAEAARTRAQQSEAVDS